MSKAATESALERDRGLQGDVGPKCLRVDAKEVRMQLLPIVASGIGIVQSSGKLKVTAPMFQKASAL